MLLTWGIPTEAQDDVGDLYTLTTKCSPEDAVLGFPNSAKYSADSSIQIIANPQKGFKFLKWIDESGNEQSSSMDFTYTMPSHDVDLIALFDYDPDSVPEPFTPESIVMGTVKFEISPSDGGYVSFDNERLIHGDEINREVGDTINVEAVVHAGFSFVNWTKNGVEISSSTSLEYTVESDIQTLVANFLFDPSNPLEPEQTNLILSLRANPEEAADSISGGGVYTQGTSIEISASIADHYIFDNWTDETGNVVSEEIEFSYTMPFKNKILTANFHYNFEDPEEPNSSYYGFICKPVSISYNGRFMTIDSEESDVTILYSLDGSYPSEKDFHYSGEFDVKGTCSVRAIAVKENFADSEVAEYNVRYYGDEEHGETTEGGILESCFEWCGKDFADQLISFRVEGFLNDDDYQYLNSMPSLRHLDIEKVADAHIPDSAFMNSKLISISLPTDITEYGDSILSASPNLSSVVWNSTTQSIRSRLTDGLINPNVLVYVPSGIGVGNPRDLNIITSGNASSIVLHYGYPYYAVNDFNADRISMTRDFTQDTQIDICSGWETLVLPFSPQTITHAVNGPAVPFAGWDGDHDGMKPFWLYSSTSSGWEAASEIEACVPYIISMPNNPDYVATSNLAGKVTFSASNVTIETDCNVPLATSWVEGTEFEGTFTPVEEDGLLSLNVGSTEGGLVPGSTFVPDAVTVPFGAYVRGAAGRRAMPVFSDGSGVSLPTVSTGGLIVETPAPGTIRLCSSRDLRVSIVTPEGAIVRTLSLKAGESVNVEGLTRGLYIVAGVKAMVR